jgi:large subunit ribosomal protein L30
MVYAVIRVRGIVNVKPDIKKTLQLLCLTRANHCVLIKETPSTKGMLQIAKDYITWGEVSKETIAQLLTKRGRLIGDKPLSNDHIKAATSYKDINGLAEAIAANKVTFHEIPDVKKVFRLHPPLKGLEGIKRSFINKGALGYRGEHMNQLVERML